MMDIIPTITTNTKATKSPETDTTDHHQTGAAWIQSAKPLTFTNGVLKCHNSKPKHRHHHLHPIVVTYKECLKNHAASLGGHALDGCGEFMPSPTATPSHPTSFKCAACGCHRNFHRREPDEDHHAPAHTPTSATIEYQPHHRHHPLPPVTHPPHPSSQRSPNSASPPPISSSYYPSAPHMLLALSGNLQQPSSAAALAAHQEHINHNNINNNNNNNNNMIMSNSGGRKRFRTKFSQNQKEKMFEFAERVGWKMQKRDEDLILELCNQVGVDRTVLKVWMHNNKNTFAKRDLNGGSAGVGGGIGRINLDDDITGNNNIKRGYGDDHEDGDNNNNNELQNLNHPFESTTTESIAHVADANGSGGSSSSS